MKKIFLLLCILTSAICAYAYEGFGTCKVAGTSDYIEGTAYVNLSGSSVTGNLVISNSCARPLQSASIKVTIDYSWKESHQSPYDGGKVTNNYTGSTTLYNSRWTGSIVGYSSGEIKLSGSIRVPSGATNVQITSVNVSINNPYCN